jgi:predicted enzyme related to lactoylglutathione lyase
MTLRGLTTISFYAADLAKTGEWYTAFLGVPPYFEVPGAYLEFRIGDDEDELGIINAAYAPHDLTRGAGGAIVYWHVDDIDGTLGRLHELGATTHEPKRARGDSGFVTASVLDPFGNILGIMTNPHWLRTRSH